MKRIERMVQARLLVAPLALAVPGGIVVALVIGGRTLAAALVAFGGVLVGLALTHQRLRRIGRCLRALEKAAATQADRHAAEMALAARVHTSIIPPAVDAGPFRIDVQYLPLEAIGGDSVCYYIDPPGDTARIGVGDVTGHGVAAALMVNRVHHETEALLRDRLPPDAILRRVNDLVLRTFRGTEMLMTFVAVALDREAGRLVWANAAHPPPLHWRADTGAVSLLNAQTTLLGISEEMLADLHADHEPLGAGDRIILHTDGLTDALDHDGRRFGMDRLVALVTEIGGYAPERIGPELIQRTRQHVRGPAQDDILVVTVAVEDGPSARPDAAADAGWPTGTEETRRP